MIGLRALELLGEGVGVVEPSGEIVWLNHRLAGQSPEVLRRFSDACVEAISAWRQSPAASATMRTSFRAGSSWFEVVMTPLSRGKDAIPALDRAAAVLPPEHREGAVALLVDASASRRIHDRLDAIDEAGSEFLRLDAESVRTLNPPERLRLLEGRVIAATRSLLGFDHFEYRLTNRRSEQLELVFCSGLVPLGIGERIYARAEGNGLSGVVAATGASIVCRDVAAEPRYIGGLPGARSTLTVPLRLHGKVIGVLNAESEAPGRFDDEDRLAAELLARYVALALNLLDMLVAERVETARSVLANLAREATPLLDGIANDARGLLASLGTEAAAATERIVERAARLDELARNGATAPSGVLGAAGVLREGVCDPVFIGRRVVVADDEPTIRRTVRAVLEQQGCAVSEFEDGATAIAAIRELVAAGTPPDLVISDVRMPDANGYEVFRAAKDASLAIPVILMTGFGYDPNHSIVRSSQEGLHCFLFKPFQVTQLLEESRKALLRE